MTTLFSLLSKRLSERIETARSTNKLEAALSAKAGRPQVSNITRVTIKGIKPLWPTARILKEQK